MAKATHLGTCQWCGRRQMLPSGVLADHGYEITGGWRRGVCGGSGHQPYELSCDLIERSIAWAGKEAARLEAEASRWADMPSNVDNVESWHRVYHPELSSRARGSVRLWELGTIVAEEGKQPVFVSASGKREALHQWGKPYAVAWQGRRAYAEALRSEALRLAEYAKTQSTRIANWVPAELIPRTIAA